MVRSASPPRPEVPPAGQDRAGPHPTALDGVLAAYWCCSVGATWTVELRPIEHPLDGASLAAPVVDWICSGVPTELPTPEAQSAAFLGDRGLLLLPAEPRNQDAPRSRSRRLIGYTTGDRAVLRLAQLLAVLVDEQIVHPMVLAAQWIDAGYSAPAAADWITAGVSCPDVAQLLQSAELDPPHPAGCSHAD